MRLNDALGRRRDREEEDRTRGSASIAPDVNCRAAGRPKRSRAGRAEGECTCRVGRAGNKSGAKDRADCTGTGCRRFREAAVARRERSRRRRPDLTVGSRAHEGGADFRLHASSAYFKSPHGYAACIRTAAVSIVRPRPPRPASFSLSLSLSIF